MNTQHNTSSPSSAPQPSTPSFASAPYDAVLAKAFDKLTSQVLIFLLAYLILVIGLGVLAPQVASELRSLIYGLPIIGVGAYVWQQQRSIVKKATDKGINVKAGIVAGEARVGGVRTDTSIGVQPDNVNVGVGLATGKGRVEGVVIGTDEAKELSTDTQYLVATFQQLSPPKRRKVIAAAQKLIDEP